jgi:hypothetical protein
MSNQKKPSEDTYSEEETIARRDATIKRMLATPPQPHSEMKSGKSKRKPEKSPKGVPAQLKKRRKPTDGTLGS